MDRRLTPVVRAREGVVKTSRVARALFSLLVVVVMFLPSFALGEGGTTIVAPECTGDPPGRNEPPPLAKPLVPESPFTSTAAKVGALPGGGGVSPTGEYTYRIPIEVPAGRAGMQPSLALSYSSRSRNGHLGVGWQLEGLSEINRCPKTLATEGISSGIRFDAEDSFCLDGQKLIPLGPFTNKADGCGGIEYRTEDDIFARIATCELAHHKIERFTVWLKDGRIREYSPNDMTESDQDVVRFNWLLTKERDRAGNAVRYTYKSGNHYYPTRIDYTFQEAQSPAVPGLRSVVFEYDPNGGPSFEDRSFRVLDDSKATPTHVTVDSSGLVTQIRLYAPSALDPDKPAEQWRYELSYAQSEITHRALLTKVRRCGLGDACGPAKELVWAKEDSTLEKTTFATAAPGSHPFVADLDGDGKDELLYDPGDGVHWLVVRKTVDVAHPLADATEHLIVNTIAPKLDRAQVADVDGDGRDEIIAPDFASGGFVILSLSGVSNTGTFLQGETFQPGTNQPLHMVDLNGDGLPDLVRGEQVDPTMGWEKSSWSYRLNLGGMTFDTKVQVGTAGRPISDPLGQHHRALVQDQGHHRATIFPAHKESSNQPWGFRLDVNGVAQPQAVLSGPEGEYARATADVDGDGIREWVTLRVLDDPPYYPVEICVERGWCATALSLPDEALETYAFYDHSGDSWRLEVADVNADGREDLVVSYVPQGYPFSADPNARALSGAIFPTGGTDTYGHSWRSHPAFLPDAFGDFDGDGLTDVVRYDQADGLWHVQYTKSGFGNNDRIVAVADEGDTSDPDHAREKVTYSTSWSPWPEQGACAHPQRCMKHGFMVVREHDVYQGKESLPRLGTQYRRTLYNYEDPRFDVHGRGFLGFGTVRQWEPGRGTETITTYDHETRVGGFYPYAFKPKTVRLATAISDTNARILHTAFTYEVRDLNAGKNHVVFPSSWASTEWEEPVTVNMDDSAKVHITGIDGLANTHERDGWRHRTGQSTYDNYGNVLETFAMTTGGVTSHTIATYEIREDDWLVGLKKTTEGTSAEAPSVARHVEYDYDKRGLLCHEYIERNNTNAAIPEVFTYFHDAEGLIRAIAANAANEPDPRTTHVTYDPSERVHPTQLWNDLGHTKATLRDPGLGLPLVQQDENGVETRWQYDALGRVVSIQRDGEARTSMAYTPRVAGPGETIGMTIEVTDETGGASRADHDELGRVVGRRNKGFDGDWIHQVTRYDTRGHVVSVSRPGVGAASSVLTNYEYDSLGRRTREARPGFEITTYDHSFYETRVVDPMGHERRSYRDQDDRVTQVLEATPQGWLATSYQYGDFGQLVRTTDPAGNHITTHYDVRGRRVFVSDPDAGLTLFTYNGFGDIETTIANGATPRQFARDAIGRVKAIQDGDGSTVFDWDLAPHGIGRVSHTESPDGTIQDFEYDELSRPKAETWTIDGRSYRFDRTYDTFGRLRSLAYPEVPGGPSGDSRMQVTHDYNPAGYFRQLSTTKTLPDGTLQYVGSPLTIEERNVDGQLTRARLFNGEIVNRTYSPETGRLLTLTSGSALSLSYKYDLDGRVLQRQDSMQDHLDTFFYDDGSLHRLTGWRRTASADPARDVGYGYDNLGNLTRVTVDGFLTEDNVYGEDHRPHTLTNNYAGAYIYDQHGRQILAPDRQVTYTEFDLPRTVTTASGTTSFAYDADQRRVKKSGPAGSTITLGGLYERRESSDGVEHVFYYLGPEGPIGQMTYTEGTPQTRTVNLHTDPLGSVGAVTDSSGTVQEWLNYEPFGARQDEGGNAVAGPKGNVLLSFAGHRHDDDLGLVDMRGRVYDPINRRFLTPDPHVTDPLSSQSYNRYSYVVNDPINHTDPTGFDPWWGGGCIGLECMGGGGIFGTGYGFGFGFSWGGPKANIGLPGAGTSTLKHPSAAPVHASDNFRATGLPVGPTAPAMGAIGPRPSGLQQLYSALTGVPINAPGWRLTNEIVADRLDTRGLHNLAAIARDGAACTFCHVTKDYRNLADADAAIDLRHYRAVAALLGTARVFTQTLALVQAQRGEWMSAWRGSASPAPAVSPPNPGQIVEGEGVNGTTVFAGHGWELSGTFTVPEGTAISMPDLSLSQGGLSEYVGQMIERTGRLPSFPQPGYYGPGSQAPRLLLTPPTPDLVIAPTSTFVRAPTLLSDLLKPNMGACAWAACRIPASL